MKLSEYIKRLQKIQHDERKKGNDPDMVCGRFSDTELVADDYPHTIRGRDSGSGWVRKLRNGENEHDEKTYVMVAQGN